MRETRQLRRLGGFHPAWIGLLLLVPYLLARADDPKPKQAAAARKANRLAKETSPYLLLHAHNPVDWYPWGPEAFAKAKAEKKPIFLSIGYSSCYWCHVMERESFMDAEIAKTLNGGFVCIKVDREERPDVDQVYMVALQAFSGSGGWPMSMFLMPDGRPFFGGTYFPPKDKEGMLGFGSLLKAVSDAWREKPELLERDAAQLTEIVKKASAGGSARKLPPTRSTAAVGLDGLTEQFDPEFGGFGFDAARPKRPKFPEPANLVYLLDQNRRLAGTKQGDAALAMVLKTLDHMARGGIRDHLAGGYHRYSTTRDWSVPHFEKMLYDNAQLAEVHLAAFERTKDPRWKAEAESTFAFVKRSLTSPEGGFYSALDAESEGEEGRTYVWTPNEVKAAVAPGDYLAFAKVYGLEGSPNFEGNRFVLTEPRSRIEAAKALGLSEAELESRLAPARAKLLAARDKRPAPLRDDKILTSWNGLMIGAYAEGYRVLKVPAHREAAERAADFLLSKLATPEGRLLRTYRNGVAKLPAYLEDYAFLADGLLKLHAATGDPKRLDQARKLVDRIISDFSDTKEGGFFYTADDHESLLARTKDAFDNAIPGANSVAIRALVRLATATKDAKYLDHSRKALETFGGTITASPAGAPLMLTAMEEHLDAGAQLTRPTERGAIAGLPLPSSGGVVKGEARLVGDSEIRLTLTIGQGYHIYGNPTGSEDLDPTTVEVAGATVDRIIYPAGAEKVLASLGTEKIRLYEKRAEIRILLKGKADPSATRLKVKYQACNDNSCLAPATLAVAVQPR